MNPPEDDLVIKEKMTTSRNTFNKLKSSNSNDVHEVLIAIEQNNLDQLHDTLMNRGTPGHALYQQWLSFDEIGDMVRNEEALTAVETWLKNESIEITWRSPRGEYIKASTRIGEWERVLNTRFYEWRDSAGKIDSVHHRSESYSVPSSLSEHISAIFNTCQVPPVIKHHHSVQAKPTADSTSAAQRMRSTSTTCPSPPCYVTVGFLNSLYGISSNTGASTLSQAVFETQSMNFSQVDLSTFQTTYKLTQQKALVQPTSFIASKSCTDNTCGEGALDIQYIMGVAQNSKSIYWYVNPIGDSFFSFLTQVASTPNPPTSLSISWGADESGIPASYMKAFNTEAMKVTAMGITIFASSGDNGVSGNYCQCTTGSGYFPAYPVNSPYVVAVGATQGPEYGNPEVVCQSNSGLTSITSGGGFSTYFPRPSYQKAAVSAYLSSSAGKAAGPGFNHTGRGYPDISFIGNLYPVIINGVAHSFAGTSASAPVAAAMITLVNTQRLARGLSTVGFIHPTLYANAGLFNDITSGSNKCCAGQTSPTCCVSAGFTAGPGWDPATGLGSITLNNLVAMFVPAVTQTPSASPNSVKTPSSPGTAASALPSVFRNSSSTSAGKGNAALTASAQAGIAFGVILGVLALAIFAWFFMRRRSTSQPPPKKTAPTELGMHGNPSHSSPPKKSASPIPSSPPPSQQSYALNVSREKLPPTPSSSGSGARAVSPTPPPRPSPPTSPRNVVNGAPVSNSVIPVKPTKPPPKPQRFGKIIGHTNQINSTFGNHNDEDGDLW